MMGAFCVSLAFELKILSIVIQEERTFHAIIKQEKYRFFRFGCAAVGALLFLGGSAAFQFVESRTWPVAGLNLASGVLHLISACLMFKKPEASGYRRVEQETEIPTII
jgi:hypothetical protein